MSIIDIVIIIMFGLTAFMVGMFMREIVDAVRGKNDGEENEDREWRKGYESGYRAASIFWKLFKEEGCEDEDHKAIGDD